MSGKKLRLKRIVSPADGRTVIFPLDHGVTWGRLPGIEKIEKAVETGVRAGADALVLHKGMLRCLQAAPGPLPGVIMHLSASTSLGPSLFRKVTVGSVEEAVRAGADAVSVHINLGDGSEPEMLRDAGLVGRACSEWQVPLLVMAYAGGDRLSPPVPASAVAHAARVAVELGADVVKIPFPGDFDTLAGIAAGLFVPVVVAGGLPAGETHAFLERVEKSLLAGAAGVAAGRSVFQHENPRAVLGAVRAIVHGGISAKEAAHGLRAEVAG